MSDNIKDIIICKEPQYNYFENIMINTFEYYGDIPDSFVIPYFEQRLINKGVCAAYVKPNGDLIAIPGGYTGEITDIGIGEDYTGTTAKTSVSGVPTDSNEIAVCWNNDTRTGDTSLLHSLVNCLNSLNTAINNLSDFAHYDNIFGVHESKTKEAIEAAIKQNKKGAPAVFLSENIIEELANINTVEKVQLFDISKSQFFQYLSKMREDQIAYIFFVMGLNYGGGTKLAQQTDREIRSGDFAKMVYIKSKLKQRERFCKKLQDMGYDINVRLNELWEKELETVEKEVLNNDESTENENRGDME